MLARETGLRPGFLGHLLVELLLDAALIAEAPERLDAYYQLLDQVDPGWVQAAVNRMAPPARGAAGERFIGAVLPRADLVGLPGRCQTDGAAEPGDAAGGAGALPQSFAVLLPADAAVAERKTDLLTESRLRRRVGRSTRHADRPTQRPPVLDAPIRHSRPAAFGSLQDHGSAYTRRGT